MAPPDKLLPVRKALPLLAAFVLAWMPMPHLALGQVPFVCTGDFYLGLSSGGNPSKFYRVEVDPQGGNVTFAPLPQEPGVGLNAIGYRFTDNLIYAIRQDGWQPRLWRIDATGSGTELAPLALDPNAKYWAADITPDGKYMILLGSGDAGDGLGFRSLHASWVDLDDPAYAVVDEVWLSTALGKVHCTDVAFDPLSGLLYGWDNALHRLVIIDPATGAVDASFPFSAVADRMGALFFDPFGQLFGYGQSFGNSQATELFQIDKTTGIVSFRAYGPAATGKDGCACPYTIRMTKEVSQAAAYPCTRVTWQLTIANQSGQARSGIELRDTLPPGMTIVEVLPHVFGGQVASGPGTNLLHLTQLEVPLGIHTLSFVVDIGENLIGTYENQAWLHHLPATLGHTTRSDNPATLAPDDPTPLEVVPLEVDLDNTAAWYCPGDTAILTPQVLDGVHFLWHTGDTTARIVAASPGWYAVTVQTGCETAFDSVLVTYGSLAVQLPAAMPAVALGDAVWLTPQVVGTPPFQYSWLLDPPAEGSCTDCAELLLSPLDTTLVRLTVTDASGCTATARTVVPVEKDYRVFVPNAFSPNDDGFNDRFLPFGKQGTEVVRLQVFDRWGELVYDVREVPAGDYPSGWDGTFHGRPMPAGVYVWRARFRFLDGYEMERSGDVLLLR